MTNDSPSHKPASRRFQSPPSLFRICAAMGSTFERDSLLKLILRLTMKEQRAQQGSILLLDKGSDQLKMLASRGLPREVAESGYIPRQGSIAEWVIRHNKPLLLKDVHGDRRFTSIASQRAIRSSMCVPLRVKGKVIGTINISRTCRETFTDQDLDALIILATQAAVSIENARLHEENIQAARLAAIGRTAAAISHGTKNMLTGLKGGIGILEMGCSQENWEIVRQSFELIKRNTERISLLVLDMLEFSKDRTPERTNVSISQVISEVFTNLFYLAKEVQVRLLQRVVPGSETLYVDPTLIYRALLNLVSNGIESIRDTSPDGGEVEVVVERAGAELPVVRRCFNRSQGEFDLIHVRDTGAGIPPDQMPELFQPFSSFKGSKGTGLGLAVTRKIAREHGGDVVVESNTGAQTVFTIVLPVVSREPGF